MLLLLSKLFIFELCEWDESRNGVNAYEMMVKNDFIHLYYNFELDTWNAKPPLLQWLIILGYKLFGFNLTGLRWSNIFCFFIYILYAFKSIQILTNKKTAFYTLFILVTGNFILVKHVFLTADFEPLLLSTSIFGFYHYLKYWKTNLYIHLYLMILGFILAFFSKGIAGTWIILTLLLIVLFLKKYRIKYSYHLFIVTIIYVLSCLSWFAIQHYFPLDSKNTFYGTNNINKVMLYYDIIERFFYSKANGLTINENYFFALKEFKNSSEFWNGFSVLIFICFILKRYNNTNKKLFDIIKICILFLLPLTVLVNFGNTQAGWYYAPLYLFFCLFLVITYFNYIKINNKSLIINGFCIIALIVKFIYLLNLPNNKLNENSNLNIYKQNEKLYNYWLSENNKLKHN
jgi:4-amino-4-deoxy-L-arabinose transferase-like glycosyltransferase